MGSRKGQGPVGIKQGRVGYYHQEQALSSLLCHVACVWKQELVFLAGQLRAITDGWQILAVRVRQHIHGQAWDVMFLVVKS